MQFDLTSLRDHAIGATAVGFVASIATVMMAKMASIGPQIFTSMAIGLGVVTALAVAAAAVMFAVLICQQD